MQQDVQNYYATRNPGEVQVIGVDLWNGSFGQLTGFRNQTGVTFPLLLLGATATGGNVQTLYGTYDNYVVISKQGKVRYHAALTWPHGDRYHLDEIRGAVDTLVTPTAGVEEGFSLERGGLRVSPNPFRTSTSVEFAAPAGAAADGDVAVLDLQGRRVATLWRGPVGQGGVRVSWSGATDAGHAAPGVYLVRARIGDRVWRRRVVMFR